MMAKINAVPMLPELDINRPLASKSAQPCGCDAGVPWLCERHLSRCDCSAAGNHNPTHHDSGCKVNQK